MHGIGKHWTAHAAAQAGSQTTVPQVRALREAYVSSAAKARALGIDVEPGSDSDLSDEEREFLARRRQGGEQ